MSLERLLRTLQRTLGQQRLPFALVGGLAVSVRVEPRFTRDADLVVAVADDARAESLIRSLRPVGLAPFSVTEQEATGRLATARLRDTAGMVCDLLLATTGIEARIAATAEPLEVFTDVALPVATVESLIAMKVLSEEPGRPQDRMDLVALLGAGPDLVEVRALLDAITAARCHRDQDLHAKLDRLIRG